MHRKSHDIEIGSLDPFNSHITNPFLDAICSGFIHGIDIYSHNNGSLLRKWVGNKPLNWHEIRFHLRIVLIHTPVNTSCICPESLSSIFTASSYHMVFQSPSFSSQTMVSAVIRMVLVSISPFIASCLGSGQVNRYFFSPE